MANRIRHVRISPRSFSPVEADLLIAVEVENQTADLEIRGRLVGPTCPYATTIEVDYPVRSLRHKNGDSSLRGRVVIPEPSYWDPISPFLYHARIELWQGGSFLDRAELRYGLRSIQLKPEGLFWNGKRLLLRAVERPNLNESGLPELRRQGINALVLSPSTIGLCSGAERLGFVVIVRVASPGQSDVSVMQSPALVGWLLPSSWALREAEWTQWIGTVSGSQCIVGVDRAGDSNDETHFFVGSNISHGVARLLPGVDGELGRIV